MKLDKYCTGCDECNKRSPLFESLTAEELKTLNGDRYSVRFHKGEVIIKQGTRADYLVSIVEGFAKMYIESLQNRNLILDFVKPWKLLGGPGVQVDGKQSYNLVAIQETLVCFIDMGNLRKVLASNSKFSEQFLIQCSGNYLTALDRLVGISQKQMPGRVADALIYLSNNVYKSPVIGEEITRQDIAEYSSMSKDSAIRVLKEFERDKIIQLAGRQIEVLDSARLHKISEKG
jgi:CRP/FNR family transcriptional regulator, polysaccharide utilization system transcription regulator